MKLKRAGPFPIPFNVTYNFMDDGTVLHFDINIYELLVLSSWLARMSPSASDHLGLILQTKGLGCLRKSINESVTSRKAARHYTTHLRVVSFSSSSMGIRLPSSSIFGAKMNTWKRVAMVIRIVLIPKSSPGHRLRRTEDNQQIWITQSDDRTIV